MKKIYSLALMLIAIISAGISFSSCSKDQMQASELSGQWRGNFGMYYTDKNTGRKYDADYTILNFYQTWFSDHGTGRQYDYYTYGMYEYQYFYFEWSVKNGVVTFHYPSDSNLDTSIYDYQMTSAYFSGYFSNTQTHFYLEKYSDSFNWSNYSGNYGYLYRNGYTYAKTRAEGTDSTSEVVPMVKNGNHFNEKE